MLFWLVLFTANGFALLLLIQSFTTKDAERLAWLHKRALACAWMAFIGAAGAIALCAYGIYYAYHVGGIPLSGARTPAQHVSKLMQGILVALLLMPLPLGTRALLNRRVQ